MGCEGFRIMTYPVECLCRSVEAGDFAEVERLLNLGVDVTGVDSVGNTPLEVAVLVQRKTLIRRLVAAGADPNYTREGGESVLMLAASSAAPGTARTLLELGADPRYVNDFGRNALMSAIFSGESRPEVVRVLLEAGADPMVRDTHEGRTARDWAERTGRRRILNIIDEYLAQGGR